MSPPNVSIHRVPVGGCSKALQPLFGTSVGWTVVVVAIDRRNFSLELKKIENHVGHRFFRTREAIKAKKPDVDVLDAMALDLQWVEDIFNETERMVSRLVSPHYTYSPSSR